jgi:agmatinase
MGLEREGDADVVVVAVPYDGSVSHDPGAAEAPALLRDLSCDAPPWTDAGVSFENLVIRDVGDISVDPDDDERTQASIRSAVRSLALHGAPLVTLGGDHSISAGVLAGLDPPERPGILWFDAHPDLMDTFRGVRGKRESRWNHACPLRRILELDGISSENTLLVGVRDFLPEELAQIRDRRLDVVWARDLPSLSPRRLADHIERTLAGAESIYISFDIDVLDPAHAPGTGVPIPGGASTRFLFDVLQELTKRTMASPERSMPCILGADLVEISPPADVNRITARAGIGILQHLLALIAAQRGLAANMGL